MNLCKKMFLNHHILVLFQFYFGLTFKKQKSSHVELNQEF